MKRRLPVLMCGLSLLLFLWNMFSATQAFATAPGSPLPPSNLRQTNAYSNSAITIKWIDSVTAQVTRYHVEWGLASAGTFPNTATINDGNATNYTITGLNANTTYRVRVRAYRGDQGLYSLYTQIDAYTWTSGNIATTTLVGSSPIRTEPGRFWAPQIMDAGGSVSPTPKILEERDSLSPWTLTNASSSTVYDSILQRNVLRITKTGGSEITMSSPSLSISRMPIVVGKVSLANPSGFKVECGVQYYTAGSTTTVTVNLMGGSGTSGLSGSVYTLYMNMQSDATATWKTFEADLLKTIRSLNTSVGAITNIKVTSLKVYYGSSLDVSDIALVRWSIKLASESLSPAGDPPRTDVVLGYPVITAPNGRTGEVLAELLGYDNQLWPIDPLPFTLKVGRQTPPTISSPLPIAPPAPGDFYHGIYIAQDSTESYWVLTGRTTRLDNPILELTRYSKTGSFMARKVIAQKSVSGSNYSIPFPNALVIYKSGSSERILCMYFEESRNGGIPNFAIKYFGYPISGFNSASSATEAGTFRNFPIPHHYVTCSTYGYGVTTNADKTEVYHNTIGFDGLTSATIAKFVPGSLATVFSTHPDNYALDAEHGIKLADIEMYNGNLHVLFVSRDGTKIYHSKHNGSSWSTSQVLDSRIPDLAYTTLFDRPNLTLAEVNGTNSLVASYAVRHNTTHAWSTNVLLYTDSSGIWTTQATTLDVTGVSELTVEHAFKVGANRLAILSERGYDASSRFIPTRELSSLGSASSFSRLNYLDGTAGFSHQTPVTIPTEQWNGDFGGFASVSYCGGVVQYLLQWSKQRTWIQDQDISYNLSGSSITVDYRSFKLESEILNETGVEIVYGGNISAAKDTFARYRYPVLTGNSGTKQVEISYQWADQPESRSWPYTKSVILNLPPKTQLVDPDWGLMGASQNNNRFPTISWCHEEHGTQEHDLSYYELWRASEQDPVFRVAQPAAAPPYPPFILHTKNPITPIVESDLVARYYDLSAFDRVAPDTFTLTTPSDTLLDTDTLTLDWEASTDQGTTYWYYPEVTDTRGLKGDAFGSERRFEDSAPNEAPPSGLFSIAGSGSALVVADDTASTPGFRCLKLSGTITTVTLTSAAPVENYTQFYVSGKLRATSAGAKLVAECLNSGSSVIGTFSAAGAVTGLDSDWETVGVRFTAPDGTSKIRVKVSNEGNTSGGKIVYWDDLSLKPVLQHISISGIDRYEIFFSSSSNSDSGVPTWDSIRNVPASETNLTVSSLPDGVLYAHIRAVDREGNSSVWQTFSTSGAPHAWTIDTTAPADPILESVTADEPGIDPNYIGGSYSLQGHYPDEWDEATNSIVIKGYARLAGEPNAIPVFVGSTTLNRPVSYPTYGDVTAAPQSATSHPSRPTEGNAEWYNASGALCGFGAFAFYYEPGPISNYLMLTDFDFDIPDDAIVYGIGFGFNRWSHSGGITDHEIRVIRNGSITGVNHASTAEWPFYTNWRYYGGEDDIWIASDETWAASEIKSSSFGFAISAQSDLGEHAEIECSEATVFYYTPAPSPGVMEFTIPVGPGLPMDGKYDFFVTASDVFGGTGNALNNTSKIPVMAPVKNIVIDNTAPTFDGLRYAIPHASMDVSTSNTIQLHWKEAIDPPFGNTYDMTYKIYRSTSLPLESPTDEFDEIHSKFAASSLEATTISRTMINQNRTETAHWAVCAVDRAGNATTTTLASVRTVYGDEDFSISWNKNEAATTDWNTTLTLNFTPLNGIASGGKMRIEGSDIELTPGLTHEWVPFLTSGTLILSVTGQDLKRVYAQSRDVNGNYSFQLRDEISFHEPAVPFRIEIVDSATSEPLAATTIMASQNELLGKLTAVDQYGDNFALDGLLGELSLSYAGNPAEVLHITDSVAEFGSIGIQAWKLGAASIKVRHATIPRLNTTKLFHVNAPGALSGIDVSPQGPLRIPSGSTQYHFTARGHDLANNDVAIDPIWNAGRAGTINRNGSLIAKTTNDEIHSTVTVQHTGNIDIRGTSSIVIDGRAPLVQEVAFDPGTEGDSDTLSNGIHTLSLHIPGPESSNWEGALPATYDIYVDQRFIGRLIQDQESTEWLDTPSLTLDTSRWRSGSHLLEVRTVDALGNANYATGQQSYRQTFKTEDGAELASGLDWLLVNQNLSAFNPQLYGTWWTDARRNPGAGDYEPSLEMQAAAIQEAAASVITLLDYDLDYISSQPNLSTQLYTDAGEPIIGSERAISVREALEAGLSRLYTDAFKLRGSDPLSMMFAAEALAAAEVRGLIISQIGLRGTSTPVSDALSRIRNEVIDPLIVDADGGYAVTDENGASRLATLMAIRVSLQALHAGDASASALLDRVHVIEVGHSLLDYLQKHEDYDLAIPVEQDAGWALNRWDEWNYNSSVFVTAEILRTLNEYQKARGDSAAIKALREMATEFLLEGRANGDGYADPIDQMASSADTLSTPTVVTTAATLLALRALDGIDPEILTSGAEYLQTLQNETDHSWNHRAFDTALAMRLVRPDLVITAVEPATFSNALGIQELIVTVRNQGIESAGPFVVTLHDSDPAHATVEQRRASEIGWQAVLIPTLAADQQTTVAISASRAAATIWIMADGWEAVSELVEENNVWRYVPSQKPDLTLTMDRLRFGYMVGGVFTQAPVRLGENWAIQVTVRNMGANVVPADRAFVTVYDGNLTMIPGSAALTEPIVLNADLGVNQSAAVVFEIPGGKAPYVTAGTHWVGARVDAGSLSEARLSNNQRADQVRIYDRSVGSIPDLEIIPGSISISPEMPQPGEVFTIKVPVVNSGGGAVYRPRVQMTSNGHNPRLVEYPGTLPGKGYFIAEFRIVLPYPGATLEFYVDPPTETLPFGEVNELDESNNSVSRYVSVGSSEALDLAVAPFTGDFSLQPRAEGEYQISARIRNIGQQSYNGALSPTPIVRATLILDNGQSILLGVRNLTAIAVGSDYLLHWITNQLSDASEAQPNRILVEIVGLEDGNSGNNSNIFYVTLTEPPGMGASLNLEINALEAHPAEATITTASPATYPLKLQFQVMNHYDHSVFGAWAEIIDRQPEGNQTLKVVPLGVLAASSNNLIAITDIPLPEGLHPLCVVIHAPFTEITTDDNEDCTLVVVNDLVERPKPDLQFVAGSGQLSEESGLLVMHATIINTAEAGAVAPGATAPIRVIAVDAADPETVLDEVVLSGLPAGAQSSVVLSHTLATTDSRTILLRIDPNDEIEETNETNNEYALDYYHVPTPVLDYAFSLVQMNQFAWSNADTMDDEGAMAFEDLRGYRITRQQGLSMKQRGFFPAKANLADSYTQTDGPFVGGSGIVYRVYSVARNGMESEPLVVNLVTGNSAELTVEHADNVYGEGVYTVDVIPGQSATAEVRIQAPNADAVELFANNEDPVLIDDPDGDVFETEVALSTGRNRFIARPIAYHGGQTIVGNWSNPVTLVYQRGIDLAVRQQKLIIEAQGYVEGMPTVPETTWREINPTQLLNLPALKPLRVSITVENLEHIHSGLFDVKFGITTIGINSGVTSTSYITIADVAVDGNNQYTVRAAFRKSNDYIKALSAEADSSHEIEETFEDNNYTERDMFDCSERADIMFVLDESGSMSALGRFNLAKEAIARIIRNDKAKPLHRYGVATYSTAGTIRIDLSSFSDFPFEELEDLQPVGGGTDIGSGVETAVNHLKTEAIDGADCVIVLVSDGDTGDAILNVSKISVSKKQFQIEDRELKVYALVVPQANIDSFALQPWYTSDYCAFQHHMSSTIDSHVEMLGAATNAYKVVNFGSAAYTGVTTRLPVAALNMDGTTDTASTIYSGGGYYEGYYYIGLTQILVNKDMATLPTRTFAVDRKSRVIVFWPQNVSTAGVSWMSGFAPWTKIDRYGFFRGEHIAPSPVWINGNAYIPYTKDNVTTSFELGDANNFYAVCVMADPTTPWPASDSDFGPYLKISDSTLLGQGWLKGRMPQSDGKYHYYKYLNKDTWEDCKAIADAQGAYLATLNSIAEEVQIYEYFNASANFLIGLHKNSSSSWVWSNGESPGYSNWHPGRPALSGTNHVYMDVYSGTWLDFQQVIPYRVNHGAILERNTDPQQDYAFDFTNLKPCGTVPDSDLAVDFYASGGIYGFVNGIPAIGEVDVPLKFRVVNLGNKNVSGVQARIRREISGGTRQTVRDWFNVNASAVLTPGESVIVTHLWNNAYDASIRKIIVEVRCTSPADTNSTNDVDQFDFQHDPECVLDFKWASGGKINGVTVNESNQYVVPIRVGLDQELNFEGYIQVDHGFSPFVQTRLNLADHDQLVALANDDLTTMQWKLDLNDWMTPATFTLNPSTSNPHYVAEAVTANNQKLYNIQIQNLYQEIEVESVSIAGTDNISGDLLIEAVITRDSDDYPVSAVSVALIDGLYVDGAMDESALIDGLILRWDPADPDTKTVHFRWRPDGRSWILFSVVADPYSALHETPVTGRT